MRLPQVVCWSVAAAAALARRAKIASPFVDLRILNICPLLERVIKRRYTPGVANTVPIAKHLRHITFQETGGPQR
jgi:hypothetical protein